MTSDQKYAELLKAVGELLQQKNSELQLNEFTIFNLRQRVEELENKINENEKE